ncbi:chemosensory pili system protein ChpA (sensor histidine kinase/response regulator) [Nitrosomonas sp. Nm84]|uniref:hybrid sensor histidine kinase/response regulator n=1 Tax=Nitrosomonas sp. Nm84 TaxID=200124 RepID=UPI000D766BCC|nr:Hpt domain-containing protein [Nitrosomonas sp. Nm84]PXW86464.1 chemosensory pili system protein ChpA (sensor histidine kinase/response regulator) [Nitrosomonas sp. Nm84]
MSAQPKLNIASIIGIKEGIYQVFSLIDQNLDAYSQHPDKINPLKDCKNYIHQLDGLLEMLGLSSITVVSEKMEQVIEALLTKKIAPNPQICDALKQSNKALLYYLNELIDGKEENPLRLFPTYRSLMQVYGFENAPESDLFFPRLTVSPALKAEAAHIDAAVAKILAKQIGTEYQAGLLKWLRDPSNKDGLQQMANAVNRIEEFPGTTEERAFWWVAAGFLEDLLLQESNQIDLSIRRLCGKIEQTIRHLAAETPSNTAMLMRELLYHIAHSESTSQRITDIKHSYAWPGQTADTNTLTLEQAENLQPILDRLRSTLMQTNDIWREFCAGHQESLVSLLEYTDWLGHLAQQTECVPLGRLINVIGDTVAYLHDQPQDTSEELAMEMATALLLVESIIDDFHNLPADLPQQIDTLASRLHQITVDNRGNELPNRPAFNAIDSRTQEKELLAQVAQEILTNLKQIENILDKFFFEPSQRSELSALSALRKQVSGALVMLDLERANTLLDLCWSLLEKLLEPDYEIAETEQILLVDGLSSLAFFIEAFRSGQPDSYQIIEEAITLFEIAMIPGSARLPTPAISAELVKTTKTATQPIEAADTAIDPELLDVFLEEVDEVLASIDSNLHNYQNNPADPHALADLRRAFHTLKGSGRMVKLDDMSEVASRVEQVLEHWLTENRPVSTQLIELIAHAHRAYEQWCKNLREHGAAKIDADELLQLTQQLILEKETVHPVTQPQAEVIKEAAIAASLEALPEQQAVPTKPLPTEVSAAPIPFAQLIVDAQDEINQELLPVFLEETQDIIPQIGGKLRGWRMLPRDEDIQHALLRLLHTLKGSARMVGALQLGKLIHGMESHVESAFCAHDITDSALDQLETEFDVISGKIEQLQGNTTLPATTEQAAIDMPADTVTPTSDKTESLQAKTIVRINAELIDRLVNDSGEASTLRSKIEAQLNNFKQSLQDLTESTHRLHDQLREVEIQAETHMQSHLAQQHDEHSLDPLEFDRFTRFQELTRLMAESVDDIITVQKSLRTTHHVAEEAVAQQSVINRQLQQSLLQIRTIPFSNYAERYYRIARQVAEDMGKKANLEIQGADVEIDRNVLEKINPPLEHLLRNAIAHGIEEPAQRLQAGKPETGQVTVQLRQESNEVIITLSDDGGGLNLPRIREEAQRLGLVQENATLDDDKIMSFIFMPGLSTTDSITGIAGRGIGLDIVKNEIAMLGGRISVNSVASHGTTFTIYLPLMLSVAQTLMVRAAKQVYAIPAFIVEHHRELDPDTLKKAYQDHRIAFNGKTYPFSHLSHLLGESDDHIPEITKHSQVLFLHSGTQYLAIHVNELISSTEVVIKNTGAQLAHAPGVEGATIAGDGEIILILNPVKLLQRNDVQKILNTPVAKLTAATQKKSTKTPTIMVVDDSLTVRKVTCRLLEREGCDVLVAKNGAEAMEIIQETIPDVMLIDLEMPKMNGFELIKNVRANPQTAKTPIIIISSRTAEKHQNIAKDLGVNVFLGKPYKENELLKHLSGLIKSFETS